MSRVGKRPIAVPDKVDVKLEGPGVRVKGPLGELFQEIPSGIDLSIDGGQIQVSRKADEKRERALHGLMRSLVANMVHGVSQGYELNLKIVGVGYAAKVEGTNLNLQIGFSHPVLMPIPKGLTLETASPTTISVKGFDKQLVGQFAANIRRIRPPEPYNGKGIRYVDEVVRRKAGKAFVTGGGD